MRKECRRIEKLIDKVVAREASGEEQEHVDSHVQSCRRCRASLRAAEKIARGIAALERPRVPGDFAARVTERIGAREETSSAPRQSPFVVALLAAAAVCLVLGTAWVLFFSGPPASEPTVATVQPDPAALLAECTEGARLVADGAGAGLLAVLTESSKAADDILDAVREGFTLFDSSAPVKGKVQMKNRSRKPVKPVDNL